MKARLNRLAWRVQARTRAEQLTRGRALAATFNIETDAGQMVDLGPHGLEAFLNALPDRALEALVASGEPQFTETYGCRLDSLSDGQLQEIAAGIDPRVVLGRSPGETPCPA